jgi:hypothetical protein
VYKNLGALKVQWDWCERWTSNAGKPSLMLPCDVASLIRLSIIIRGLRTSRFWKTLVNKVIETARSRFIVGDYNIAQRDASMGLLRFSSKYLARW